MPIKVKQIFWQVKVAKSQKIISFSSLLQKYGRNHRIPKSPSINCSHSYKVEVTVTLHIFLKIWREYPLILYHFYQFQWLHIYNFIVWKSLQITNILILLTNYALRHRGWDNKWGLGYRSRYSSYFLSAYCKQYSTSSFFDRLSIMIIK